VTRINIGIPVKELHYKHLLAEHREIVRVPTLAKRRTHFSDIPKQFTLGRGHVKFFYDKLKYLRNRYEELFEECINRGFNVTYYGTSWADVPEKLMGDYIPTQNDIEIIEKRLKERAPKN
jgi:hypothetical protein